jgi:endonuclease/exonuclease/phosphatase family metal-dependent hydrolase
MKKLITLILSLCYYIGHTQQTLKVISYNLRNYESRVGTSKSESSKSQIAAILARINPDVAVLYEVRSHHALKDLVDRLSKKGIQYPYTSLVQGYDQYQHIAIISKIKPTKELHQQNRTYTLKGQRRQVLRGFACCRFHFSSGYDFFLIGAHLKAKSEGSETWRIRDAEARCLRSFYQELIKKNGEKTNILLVGDFNDTQDSSPIKIILNSPSNQQSTFYDLRPVDQSSLAWTHHWGRKDQLSRIDYIFGNQSILPEIRQLGVDGGPSWNLASDHRPLVVELSLQEASRHNFHFNRYWVRMN